MQCNENYAMQRKRFNTSNHMLRQEKTRPILLSLQDITVLLYSGVREKRQKSFYCYNYAI